MAIELSFLPDVARARKLDARMSNELAASLSHILEAISGNMYFDRNGLQRLIQRLEAGKRVPPGAFGRYYEIVRAIDDGQYAAAETLLRDLIATRGMGEHIDVLTMDSPELAWDRTLYRQKWFESQSIDLDFDDPEPEMAKAFKERLAQGLALMKSALPELHGEISHLVHQIVIASSDPTKPHQFDGGSHYQLWGALFLNCRFHPDRVAIVEVLAHECAHTFLFGFCIDEQLTMNSPEALYASPLRRDPRPMDGIYHATFVSARMHWAMSQLAKSDLLTEDERERALQAAQSDHGNFLKGHGVVAEHGQLTQTGRILMDGAYDYIRSAA